MNYNDINLHTSVVDPEKRKIVKCKVTTECKVSTNQILSIQIYVYYFGPVNIMKLIIFIFANFFQAAYQGYKNVWKLRIIKILRSRFLVCLHNISFNDENIF